jgi:D-amino-acid dehydrogenase
MKTIVLGSGIIGTMTAYYLVRHGHEVTVIDRQSDVARECSFANGGFIAIGQAIPWSAPGMPLKALRTFGQSSAPILLRLPELPRMWRWGLQFLRCCTARRSWENTGHVLRLSLYSARALDEVRAETGIAYDALTKGSLKVYSDAAALDDAARLSERQRPLGLNFEVIDTARCVSLVPGLAPKAQTLRGGIFYPDEQSGDCLKFANGIAEFCRARGAEFLFDTVVGALETEGRRITGVVTDKGRLTADNYVLSLGADSPIIARTAGIRLPIYPIKGYSITVPSAPWDDAPAIPVLDEERKFGLTPFGERLRLTGFAEAAGYDTTPREDRFQAFVAAFLSLFPDLRKCIDATTLDPHCCLRPVTPQGPPILGASRYDNLYYNTGQGHLGWTHACGSGRLVADIVDGRTPEMDMNGYTLDGR